MKWPKGFKDILREETSGEPAGSVPPKNTVTLNGKEVSIEDATAAFNLYRSMQDPEISKEIVGTLALRMGLLNKDGEVKGNREEVADKLEGKVTKMLRAKFGKDGEKFVDMAGPAIDEAIKQYMEEHGAKTESTAAAGSWDAAVDEFAENFPENIVPQDISDAMKSVISEMGGVPKGLKGKAAQTYLQRMYKLAVEESGIEPPANERGLKSLKSKGRNRRDPEDDLPEFKEVDGPKNPTLDQIVDAAAKGIRFRR